MESRLLEAETGQFHTFANGKARGTEWTVLVRPHRDSMSGLVTAEKPDLFAWKTWLYQENEKPSLSI